MEIRKWYSVALVAALATCLVGCGVHRAKLEPSASLRLPASFSHSGSTETPDRWWTALGSPVLDDLVETALDENLDLRAAWARLDQARALGATARAPRRPQVDASIGANRFRQVFLFGGAASGMPANAFYRSQYDVSVSAGYELDLWNRMRYSVMAANRDTAARRSDLEAMAMTLVASITETWVNALEQRRQLEVLQDQILAGETFLELIELRLGQGMASALDVYQQRQQVASTRANIPLIRSALALLENRLNTLLGNPPGTLRLSGHTLPTLSELPDTGLPLELLERRPDVRSALERLLSADSRVRVAIAQTKPSLRLNASTGFSAATAGKLFNTWIWSLGAQLLTPILDGGRRRAELRRTKAVVEERIHTYGSSVLTAIREVEDALILEFHQRAYLRELESNLELAQATLDEAKARYLNGLSDYLSVLAALQALQGLERNLISAHRQLIAHRISLHRALGGTWMGELQGAHRQEKP